MTNHNESHVSWRGRSGAKRAIALALALVSLAASGTTRLEAQHDAELNDFRMAVVPLRGTVLVPPALLSRPSRAAVVGGALVIIDAAADSAILAIDRDTGHVLFARGRRGKGPGEFSGPWSIDADVSDEKAFWIYDLELRRLTRMDLASERTSHPNRHTIALAPPGALTAPHWLADHSLISPGFFTHDRLVVMDSTGRAIRFFGETPPGTESAPVPVRQHAYQSSAALDPARRRVALVTRHADRLDVYSTAGAHLAANERPFSFEPVYTVGQGARGPILATDESLRFGYIDVAASRDFIFALYSGRTREGFPGRANFGEYVHVYDWGGHLQSVLHVEGDLIGIACDPVAPILYGIREDPEPAILRYTLPAMPSHSAQIPPHHNHS